MRAIDEGDLSAAMIALRRPMPDARADGWSATADVEIGALGGSYYARPTAHIAIRRSTSDHSRDLTAQASAGFVTAGAPSQRLFVLGGLGSLPGYAFRSFAGRRYGLLEVQASVTVIEPWLRLRAVSAIGAAGGLPDLPLPVEAGQPAWAGWPAAGSGGLRASAGGGVSLLWDLLRLDAVRGLNGGDWRLVISFHPELRDIS
jgi:hypothetical protein